MIALGQRGAARLAAGIVLIAAASPATATRAEAPSGSATAADATTWSLAADMEAHPDLNPFPDAHGHAATWSLYAGPAGADPSSYVLLPEQTDGLCGSSDVRGWRDGNLPLVVVNTSEVNHCALAHTVLAHSSPDRDAIIGWTAPSTTTVTVGGRLVDDDAGGGNGVGYRLFTGSTTLGDGTIPNGGSVDLDPRTVPIDAGDRIYLAVTALDGNSDYDSTQVDLTVSSASAQPSAALRRATPSSLRQGASGPVTLVGTGFTSETRVALDDQDGVQIGTPTVVSATKLKVPVTVSEDAASTTRHWQVFEDGTAQASCSDPSQCALTVVGTPRLDSIDPATIARGQGIELSLSGSGFAPGMTVKISGPGVVAGPLNVTGPTSAQVHLDASPTARPGRRAVTLTSTDGAKSTLKRALAVVR